MSGNSVIAFFHTLDLFIFSGQVNSDGPVQKQFTDQMRVASILLG
jgi:hypothetical protein